MKTLSIIIPTYNMEKYLERCILSMTNNTKLLNDIEIVIVNDGSTDESLTIAKKYRKFYPKTILIIDKENGGHGSTINEGIKISKGKYLKVVDADDWIDIDSFETFVNDLKTIDTDAVVTNYVYENVYENSYEIVTYSNFENYKKYKFSDMLNGYFPIHSITYKRDILLDNNIKLDEKTFYVDMEYLMYPLPFINDFTYLNCNLYRYFIGRPDQSVSAKSLVKHRKDHEKVIKSVLLVYKNKLVGSNNENYSLNILRTLLRTHYIIYCKCKCNNKNSKQEIRSFTKYLKKNFKNLYKELLRENLFIKWNIRTNFLLSQFYNCMFSRIADKFDKRGKQL